MYWLKEHEFNQHDINNFVEYAREGKVLMLKKYRDKGMNVNAQNIKGTTALMNAVLSDWSKEAVSALLAYDADPDIQNREGDTALIWAAQRKNKDVVELLLKYGGADPSIKNNQGRDALFYAKVIGGAYYRGTYIDEIKAKSKAITDLIRSAIDLNYAKENSYFFAEAELNSTNFTRDQIKEFFLAIESSKLEVIKNYLDMGMDPNITVPENNARHDWFIGDTALILAIFRAEITVIRLLLSYGADVNKFGFINWTALHIAAFHGYEFRVKVLLDAGANIDAQNESGNTALILSAERGWIITTKILLDRGADINIKNNGGYTVVDYPVIRRDGIKELIYKKMQQIETDKDALENSYFFAESEEQFTDKNINDFTDAARYNDIATLERFLDAGMSPNVLDDHKCTALRYASAKGHVEAVELLLANGADPNIKDKQGYSALTFAKNDRICKLLLNQNRQ